MSQHIIELKENKLPKNNRNKRNNRKNTMKKKNQNRSMRKPPMRNRTTQNRRKIENSSGGSVNRFPSGNLQGTNFRSGKVSRESDMEYIGEIVSNSTGFSVVNQYACNPGQVTTFPWLSKKAQLYEKYEFKSLEFIYKPEVSQFASLGTTGKIILSFDYDASDPPPSSKQNAEDTDPSADGLPYQEICLKCKPRELHKNSNARFVRPGGLPGGSDIKTYDCGNLFVSISGIEANAGTLGELWVRYNCVLSVPILESTNIAPTNYFVSSQQDTAAALTTTVAYRPLFAAAASNTVVNVNGIGLVNTAGSLVPPPGNYIFDVDVEFLNATGNDITQAVVEILKNGNLQGPNYAFAGPGLQEITIHGSAFISCNGTDVISVSVFATFTNTTAVTSVYRLVAI